jgi:hypothetical protein
MKPPLAAVLIVLAASPIAACGRPTASPQGDVLSPARRSPRPTATAPATAEQLPPPAPPPVALPPAAGGFAEGVAVPCAGRPGGEQIVALLRRNPGVLPPGANPTVAAGPLCAGTWQYTVVTQPNMDPLQVVSNGAPGALTLVTAGTDVCTPEVKAGAPFGILTAAHC